MRMTKSQIAQIVREEIQNLIKEKDIKPISDYVIEEAEYQGKKVELGKVKRGGTKSFMYMSGTQKRKMLRRFHLGTPLAVLKQKTLKKKGF